MSNTLIKPEQEKLVDTLVKDLVEPTKAIVLYDDPVNTFDHVISCLQKYCEHSAEQAHQCTLIIHHNGKYAVKHGSYDRLKPVCEALLENKLTAKIED